MDANQPCLFDLPARERAVTAGRSVRGRNGETWSRTAAAEVTIIDAGALVEAAAQAAENAMAIGLSDDPGAEDTDPGSTELVPSRSPFDPLRWLMWPTADMEGVLQAGAFRVLSMDTEVMAESFDLGTVTWTVTVTLTDVDALRRLAAHARPDAAESITESFAVAWRCAADPFAPLRSIPGIAHRAGQVDVEHLPTRR